MTSGRYPGRRVRRGRPGLPGTAALPAGWINSTEARLTALETGSVTLAISDLTDVGPLTGITAGQVLRWDAVDNRFEPNPLPSITFNFDMAFVLDGAGVAIPAKTWYSGMRLNFACILLGFTLVSPFGGTITAFVERATYAAYPTFTGISGTGSQRPTLSTGNKIENFALTGWTTALAAGDLLKIASEAGTSQYAVLTLHLRRTLTLG